MRASAIVFLLVLTPLAAGEQRTATGSVFHDVNANGVLDAGEPGVQNVLVSNGREVVRSARDGSYELPVDDDTILFVCKPAGWMVPVDPNGLPRHFYLHKPNGSPDLEFGGVAPTGPLPERVDFPLVPQDESERFNVILFGDPQPYSIEQVDHFKNDIVPDVLRFLEDEDAAFGVTLGDIVGDDLDLFGPLNDVVGATGLPWLNVYGNHDMDYDSPDDEHADETFNRVYGPTTYAFVYAHTHFIVLDNVLYGGQQPNGKKGAYKAGLSAEQQDFLRNYFYEAYRSQKDRFVLLMHIPAIEFDDLMSGVFGDEVPTAAPHAIQLSVGAHWHRHGDFMMESVDGDGVRHTHHHVVNGTTSGSWWQGQPDEYGIPHAMMRDGKPNGWSVLTIDPDLPRGYEIRYKAARRPWDDQMHIVAPDAIRAGERPDAEYEAMHLADDAVVVNLWSGSRLSKVEVRYVHNQTGDATAWRTMTTERGTDPYWARLKALEAKGEAPKMTTLNPETDLWVDRLPEVLEPGSYTIEVRETNMYGRVHTAKRVVRVTE